MHAAVTAPSPPLIGLLPAFRRDRLELLRRLALEHGDAVRFRIGPQEVLLLSHPDAVTELLVRARVGKGPALRRARVLLGDGLLTSEAQCHRRQRRLLQPAFTERQVAGWSPAIAGAAAATVSRWRADEPLDVHHEALRFALSAAGSTLLSLRVDDDAVIAIGAAVDDVLAAYTAMLLPLPGLVRHLPVPAVRRLRRGSTWLRAYVEGLVAARRRSPPVDDPLGRLLTAGVDERLVVDEVVTLLLAGHETTAGALTWALHLLAGSPHVQEALAAEVRTAVGARAPGAADLRALPGLRAAMAEALRLYPPSWAMGRTAEADQDIAGIAVRRGTVLVASQWVVHRDARWWPDPDRFRPSRFRPGRWHGDCPRGAYFPFGAGARRCIGEHLAWLQGVLALAVVLQRWHLDPPPPGTPAPRAEPSLTLRPRGVVVVPRRRG